MDATTDLDEFNGLQQKIRNMLISSTDQTFQKLSLIDVVQRIYIISATYNIEDELENLSADECDAYDGNGLHTVALQFWLLRQQRYHIPWVIISFFII